MADPILKYITKVLREEYTLNEIIFAKNTSINERYEGTNHKLERGGKILTDKFKKEGQKQIQAYIKEDVFLSKEDSPVLTIVPIDRFISNNADIKASQLYVWRSGVNKWKRKIKEGERPFILVDYSDVWKENRILDGHHRLTAYEQLGIKDIPIIDKNGKVTTKYRAGDYITPVTPMPGKKIGDYEKEEDRIKQDLKDRIDIAKVILLRKVK